MTNQKTKTKISIITLILTITISSLLTALPIATAHTPAWDVPTHAFISVKPDPVGVNQLLNILVWLAEVMPGAAIGNDIRFHDYTLTITKPTGNTEEIVVDVCTDPTSSQWIGYYPDEVGTYTFRFDYPGQTYTWSGDFDEGYSGDYYLPSSAETTIAVQEEPIATIPSYGLPQEYWTRPIYGENTDWWYIASNWFGDGSPQIRASFAGYQVYVPDAVGSLTSHVMWTSRLQSGGVVGGEMFPVAGDTYFEGTAYLPRFENPIIMDGMLFYKEPYAFASTGFRGSDDGAFVCVDLRTGEELWRIDMPSPTFGLIFNVQNYNQHGVHQPLLVAPVGTTWVVFDAFTGYWLFNATNVPSGSDAMGPNGEFLKYVFINQGTEEDPVYSLGQWNSSKLWWGASSVNTDIAGQVRDASITSGPDVRYDWIVPLPWLDQAVSLPDWSAAGVRSLTPVVSFDGDLMLCYNGTLPATRTRFGPASWEPYTYFAINLDESRGDIGEVLWWKTYDAPPGNLTVGIGGFDQENHIWLEEYKETNQWVAYSMDNGERIWGPTDRQEDWDYYGTAGMEDRIALIANDKVYSMMFSGVLYCYDELTGDLLWTYGNSNEDGNSTRAGYENAYGVYPTLIMAMGRDMIYAAATEHTINTPIYKGARVICIDANDGTEVWDLSSFVNSFHSISLAIADGFTTWWNGYCNQIFTTGRGPSELTLEAPLAAVKQGESIILRGTVLDIATGTTQDEQAARFPNGVPAVSDDCMTDWMEYVYMQRPRPEDVTGVAVKLAYQLQDGTWKDIDQVTSDEYGNFGFKWTPPDEGTYVVKAFFLGSDAYWGSSDVTYIAVDPASVSAEEIAADAAQRTINMLPAYPDVPTQEQIADDAATRTIAMLPQYPAPADIPDIPAYLTIDLVIIVLVAISIIIGLYGIIRKQK